MEISNQQLSGLCLAYRRWELYWLESKKENQKMSMDYFKLEKLLYNYFQTPTVKKILENLNCDHKLILDFDKKVAKLVLEKDEPFENHMKAYFDPKYIQNVIDNPEDFEQLYSNNKYNIKSL